MKSKWQVCLFVAPIIVVLALILIGAGTGRTRALKTPMYASPFSQQTKKIQPEIVPGVVVVKVKSATTANALAKPNTVTGLSSLDTKLQRLGATSVQKMFRHKPIPPNSYIPDISRILKIRIPERLNPIIVARELERDPNVEYAEPVYIRRLLGIPNDPMYAQQHHLPQIHAPEAWDVQRGDSTVVIAIVDNGTDYKHEDLAANVWTNELEANGVTGVDDDGNGFVDDIHGWDFGDNDADPINPPSSSSHYEHGTSTAGLACAVTNNLKGIAGVSWNCTFMPVKHAPDDDPNPYYGYEGIVYAADNGADVISNSWGYFGYSQWEQEIINYAYSKGAVIVCAAGNNDLEQPSYPASYQHVISVAAVRANDTKASYSNFGAWIDICAPGGEPRTWLLSTYPKNQYWDAGQTSATPPIVAGVCGLVKSLHPDWSNDQVIRQVLLTADNIDALNPQYLDKLGYGRVNAHRALTEPILTEPDARLVVFSFMIDDSLYGNDNGVPEKGETIHLHCKIHNYSIGSTEAATLRLSCSSASVEILDGTVSPVYFPADTTLPFDFNFRITESASVEQAELVLTLETGQGYYREERFEIAIGVMPLLFVDNDQIIPDMPQVENFFRDILDKNHVLYGYWNVEQSGFPESKVLLNFPIVVMCSWVLGNFNLTDEEYGAVQKYLDAGNHLFICGQDIAAVLYEDYGTEEAKTFMRDYLHAEYIAMDSEDQEVMGVANDAISHDLSFHIWQPGLSAEWQGPDVIAPTAGASTIFTYRDGRAAAVKYAGDHKVVYLAFGLEAVDSDQNTQIGDPSPIRTELLMRIINWLNFIEHKPLSDTDNVDSSRTVVARITGNVTDLQAMTLFWRLQGKEDFTAVIMAENDSGYYSAEIPAQDSGATVEYYVQTEHPYYNWHSPVGAPATVYSYKVGEVTVVPAEFQLKQNYPNPFNPNTAIEFTLPKTSFVRLKIYNVLSEEVATLVSDKLPAGNYKRGWSAVNMTSGMYYYRLQAGDFIAVRKLLLLK